MAFIGEILLILLGIFCVSWTVTLTGFGVATMLLPLMALFYPFEESLMFVTIIHLFSDISRLGLLSKGLNLKLLLTFGVLVIIGTATGAWLLSFIEPYLAKKIFALLLIVYIIFKVYSPRIYFKPSLLMTGVGGLISGFTSGLVGIGGAIMSVTLRMFDLPYATYLSTLAGVEALRDPIRLSIYFYNGIRLPKFLIITLILSIPVILFATWFAYHTIKYFPVSFIRRLITILLLVTALKLLID
jgi:uncharacterized protein